MNGSEYRQQGDSWQWSNPTPARAEQQDEWYQGRQGQWVQQQNAWRFRDTDGNEYRQYGDNWRWSNPSTATAAQEEWYQGRRGQWVQRHNRWQFRDVDGNEYRQYGDNWRWYNGRLHSAEGSAYHNRPAGDNRTYSEFQQQEGR